MSNQYPTAASVLVNVERLIVDAPNHYKKRYEIRSVSKELRIIDWWPDYIGLTRLKDMRKFLREAIKLGYTGYVCFVVGITGAANGMWAYVEQSTDGHLPDGPVLYKSFTPEYEYWRFSRGGDELFPRGIHYDEIKTIRQLERAISEHEE